MLFPKLGLYYLTRLFSKKLPVWIKISSYWMDKFEGVAIGCKSARDVHVARNYVLFTSILFRFA